MDITPAFTGFPKAGLQFLADLAQNNDRVWFEANKHIYETSLLEPAQAFIMALGKKLENLAEDIVYGPQTDGRGVLMRMHRDTRFSADKSPYKTRVSGLFREGRQKKMESPAFGFQIDANSIELITGMYKFTPEALTTYRAAVARKSVGDELVAAIAEISNAGSYTVAGEHYKRVPAGYDPEYAFAHLLRYDGLYALSPRIDSSDMQTAALVDRCYAHFQQMAPLYNWLKRHIAAT
jgi:uncharacterized protein (TIGR02453 family)